MARSRKRWECQCDDPRIFDEVDPNDKKLYCRKCRGVVPKRLLKT